MGAGADRLGCVGRAALMVFVIGVLAGLTALGVLVVMSAWTPGRPGSTGSGRSWSAAAVPASWAVVSGSVVLAATGWIVGCLAGAVGGWVAARAWERRGRTRAYEQARIEALASWCEQLRDLLSADHGIVATVDATVRTCPAPIYTEVSSLSARLGRQSPDAAIGQFALEMDDPSGDLVASVLRLAMSRSSRTSELLSELATTIRERAAMRLRVEADRAGQRSEARFVIGFSAVVLVGVLVFGRDTEFLDAYDTASGQITLAIVLGLFGVGGWWLNRLTRFDRPARFLTIGTSESTSGLGRTPTPLAGRSSPRGGS